MIFHRNSFFFCFFNLLPFVFCNRGFLDNFLLAVKRYFFVVLTLFSNLADLRQLKEIKLIKKG